MNQTVKILFEQFCNVYNVQTKATSIHTNPTQKDFYSNDRVVLDYAPIYGGYRIDIINKDTSQSHFDSSSRRPAKEMIAYLRGLLAARNNYILSNLPTKETSELAH